MNWKTTIGLLVLTLIGAAWWFHGDDYAIRLHLKSPPAPAAIGETLRILSDEIRPGNVGRIRVSRGKEEVLELTAKPSEPFWALPGNWPARPQEVRELVNLITNIQSRFEPIALTETVTPSSVGITAEQQPIVVTLSVGVNTHVLTFGRPPLQSHENPFTRSTYLRVDDQPEVLRLGPDVFGMLDHSPEYYRTRQLFPGLVRVRVNGLMPPTPPVDPMAPPPPPPVPSTLSVAKVLATDQVTSIELADSGVAVRLDRVAPTPVPLTGSATSMAARDPAISASELAKSWQISAPMRDRVDPDTLVKLLEAIPDLWVEQFVDRSEAQNPEFVQRTGLDHPTRTIRITFASGDTRHLRIGSTGRVLTRREPVPIDPMNPPQPGSVNEREVREPLFYAQIDGSPEIFEIRGSRFGDLFVAANRIRDAAIVRILGDRMTSMTLTQPGQPEIVLQRTPGDPDSKTVENREDRWNVQAPFTGLAETNRITEILTQLSELKARPIDIVDGLKLSSGLSILAGPIAVDPMLALGLTPTQAITLKIVEGLPTGERTTTLRIGQANPTTKKLPVLVDGWPRISFVDSTLRPLVSRDALAFRSRKIFDWVPGQVVRLTVDPLGGDRFELDRDMITAPWKLTKPVQVLADGNSVGQLITTLERIEAVEYVSKTMTDAELSQMGLNPPAVRIRLQTAGLKQERTLILGKSRDPQGDVYARVDSGDVFMLSQAVVDLIKAPSLGYRPKTLFADAATANAIVLQRPNAEQVTLTTKVGNWVLTAPYAAKLSPAMIEQLIKTIRESQIERWVSNQVTDWKQYDLDPATQQPLRLGVTSPGSTPEAPSITTTILIGNPVEAGKPSRFARYVDERIPGVFVISGTLFQAVDHDPLDWLDRQLLTFDITTVAEIRTTSPSGAITLQRDANGWIAGGKPAFPIDRLALDNMLQFVSQLQARRFVAFGPKTDFAEFGLDDASKPASLMLITPERTIRLTLGKISASGERYVRIGDQNGVAALPSVVADNLKTAPLDFADRGMLKFESSDLLEIRRVIGTDQLALISDPAGWKLTEPKAQKADAQTMDELAETLSRLRANRVVLLGTPERLVDGKPYGLTPPAATVTLTVGEKSEIIYIGSPVDAKQEQGERFAQISGVNRIFVLPALLSKRLMAPAIAFRDRSLASFVNADRIEISAKDRKRTFSKQSDGWRMTQPISADAEDATLRELHDNLAKLRADALVTDKATDLKPYGLDQPTRWKLFDGDKLVLSLLVGGREKLDSNDSKSESVRLYAKIESSDQVVLLDDPLSRRLMSEYRKRALWPMVDVSQVSELKLSLTTGESVLRKTAQGWRIETKPGESVTANAERVAEILATLSTLQADQFVEDDRAETGMNPYGFDSKTAQGTITLTTPAGPLMLKLGGFEPSTTREKRVFARVPGQSSVVVLSQRDTAILLRDPKGFVTPK